MTGKIHTHWLCLRSHAHPTASDVSSGMLCLGTDGNNIFVTNSAGNTIPLAGGAITKNIVITGEEFDVRDGSGRGFISITNAVAGSENVVLGDAAIATLDKTEFFRNSAESITGTYTVTAADTINIASTGSTTTIGAGAQTTFIGSSGATGAVRIANTGVRSVRVGSNSSTEFIATAQNSSVSIDSTGLSTVVATGQEYLVKTQNNDVLLATDYGNTGNITIGTTSVNPQLTVGADLLLAATDAQVGNNLTVGNNVTINGSGNLILTGGGEITNGADTVIGFNANGELTQLGDSSNVTTNHVLTWNGSKWTAAASSGGGGASALTDLSDVDNGMAPNNHDVLIYDSASSTFSSDTVNNVIQYGSIHSLSDVNTATATTGQFLVWTVNNQFTPTTVSIQDLDSVNITTGAGIDGYSIVWDDASSTWTAANVSGGGGGHTTTLSQLTDVDTTGVADGHILQYDGQTDNRFEPVTVASVLGAASINDLGNVDISGITDGQVLTWDNASSQFSPGSASASYTDSDAVSAVEGASALVLDGTVTTKHGNAGVLAAVGGGTVSMFSEEFNTYNGGTEFFNTKMGSPILLEPGYRYQIRISGFFSGYMGAPPDTHIAILLRNAGGTEKAIFASKKGITASDVGTQEELFFSATCDLVVFDDPLDGVTKRYITPSGFAGYFSSDPNSAFEFQTAMVGWDPAAYSPLRYNPASASQTANAMAVLAPSNTLNDLYVGCVVSNGAGHSSQNNVNIVITGVSVNAFPGLEAPISGSGANWPVLP